MSFRGERSQGQWKTRSSPVMRNMWGTNDPLQQQRNVTPELTLQKSACIA
ncbi:UNVERIFIED_CONTAM: hypothetical protein Slati_1876000 [Sesamum latifolium]|uniref:Uncharacterized protein n=1 Tax=Sesamum latifolium TaxID=2727402 RepID=A0AAW2X3B7_9LAMI